MKKVFIILSSAAFIFGLLNCANTPTANNSDLSNANSQVNAAPTAETNEIANVKAKKTPLPVFTDANQAMAKATNFSTQAKTKKQLKLSSKPLN